MKNLLTISLIVIYLLGNTEFSQLLNLPALVHHYQQDHYRNHKINFIRFLTMHYCTDDGTSADDDDDNKLPFKQVHVDNAVFAVVADRYVLQLMQAEEELPVAKNSLSQTFIKNIYLHIPLRPPAIDALI